MVWWMPQKYSNVPASPKVRLKVFPGSIRPPSLPVGVAGVPLTISCAVESVFVQVTALPRAISICCGANEKLPVIVTGVPATDEDGATPAGPQAPSHSIARPSKRADARLGERGPSSGRYLPGTIPSEVLGNPVPTAFHVSTRGEYGMRLMVDLARHWGQGTVSLHAVAQREDLPEAYLEQLVAALRKAGLVNGKRGAGGGYTLARDPQAITAGDVVRALEGPIEPQICTAEGDPVVNCVREPDCGTRAVWLKLQSSIATALDSMTLAELAKTTTRERVSV